MSKIHLTSEIEEKIRGALESSCKAGDAYIFPTILSAWPKNSQYGFTSADVAIHFFRECGLSCHRTEMGIGGYPGIFRDLVAAPPWEQVEHEDVDDPLEDERYKELEPLYIQANQTSIRDLIIKYQQYLDGRDPLAKKFGFNGSRTSGKIRRLQVLIEKLLLARCLGNNDFQALHDAIFDFDEPTPAIGAPDLFVWNPTTKFWFFAEVKGPRDHLRRSQAAWVSSNWDRIKGRFALLVGIPNA